MAQLVVSYSREDRALVREMVVFLKASLRIDHAVFWDDDFEPGEPWFEQIKAHIVRAPQLFVFWCKHSAVSFEVRREYMFAIEQGKLVVPVLLDGTPLNAELALLHGINLQMATAHPQLYDLELDPESASRWKSKAVAHFARALNWKPEKR